MIATKAIWIRRFAFALAILIAMFLFFSIVFFGYAYYAREDARKIVAIYHQIVPIQKRLISVWRRMASTPSTRLHVTLKQNEAQGKHYRLTLLPNGTLQLQFVPPLPSIGDALLTIRPTITSPSERIIDLSISPSVNMDEHRLEHVQWRCAFSNRPDLATFIPSVCAQNQPQKTVGKKNKNISNEHNEL